MATFTNAQVTKFTSNRFNFETMDAMPLSTNQSTKRAAKADAETAKARAAAQRDELEAKNLVKDIKELATANGVEMLWPLIDCSPWFDIAKLKQFLAYQQLLATQ